ncbi:MAG: PH domain-containing protein [Sciscionella sp.]|nr:PH domain-containing protein [Sciscionella sp.]
MAQLSTPANSVLRDPQHQVSPTARWWWATRAAIRWLIVIAAVVALVLFADAPAWLLYAAVVCTGLAIAHVVVMPLWRYRVHRWEASADAVYAFTGWLSTQWRVVPLSRIQTVDTKRGALERLFRLATVTVTTASAAGEVRITGLDVDVAGELVEHLTATTQATPGDAT